jgi:hypothetical protein
MVGDDWRLRELALDVLGEHADEIAARIVEHERLIGAEVARLAAMRRPLARLAGQDAMAAKKSVAAINVMIGDRFVDDGAVRAIEPTFQRLADALIGDAGAMLEST